MAQRLKSDRYEQSAASVNRAVCSSIERQAPAAGGGLTVTSIGIRPQTEPEATRGSVGSGGMSLGEANPESDPADVRVMACLAEEFAR